MMFHRLTWTHFVYYILAIRLFLSLSMNLTSHFSNFADFRRLQISNASTKYYEILPDYTKTPHDTNHKIASLYFEYKYHFSTLQKKFRLLLNKGVNMLFSHWVSLYVCVIFHLMYSIFCRHRNWFVQYLWSMWALKTLSRHRWTAIGINFP